MKVLYDANIVLDVFQRRELFYEASALALNAAIEGSVTGYFPAHAVPTISYVLRKHTDQTTAANAVSWLLGAFEIAPCNIVVLKQAAVAEFKDFEDAVVAYSASECQCDAIVTRNSLDFRNSPVPTLSPTEFLQRLA
ncbi:MAG: PIN domain-containing protein [Candidatus Hydrogenedentes bacterium]|nr:PIN domain-containing protein [Candidatus Hydrogenedentota bacterium]